MHPFVGAGQSTATKAATATSVVTGVATRRGLHVPRRSPSPCHGDARKLSNRTGKHTDGQTYLGPFMGDPTNDIVGNNNLFSCLLILIILKAWMCRRV